MSATPEPATPKKKVEWNPRFAAYTRANGFENPQDFIDQDPPTNIGFTRWNRDHIIEFAAQHPGHIFHGTLASMRAHAAYDAWLIEKYPII